MTLLKTAKQIELYWRYCVLTANRPCVWWIHWSTSVLRENVSVSCFASAVSGWYFGMFTTVTSCYFFMNVLCMNTCSCASCIFCFGGGGIGIPRSLEPNSPLSKLLLVQLIWFKDLWLTGSFLLLHAGRHYSYLYVTLTRVNFVFGVVAA